MDQPVAHFNIARLSAPPGDPRVAEFVDNTGRVNAVAMRSPGYLWHLAEQADLVTRPGYAGQGGDPCLAYSLSVWTHAAALADFVRQTIHGAFLRRKAEWFLPWDGPNHVVWPWTGPGWPTVAEGRARLAQLAADGPGPDLFDLASPHVAHR
jgi:Domain of unknown function (DUF3291)